MTNKYESANNFLNLITAAKPGETTWLLKTRGQVKVQDICRQALSTYQTGLPITHAFLRAAGMAAYITTRYFKTTLSRCW